MSADLPAPATIPPALLDGLNPEQAEAVSTLSGALLVVAGPGSGKTRVLTHRIAALLATGTSPGAILSVTFTNKAAAEMRDRVGRLVGQDKVARMWIATFHSACVRILRAHHDLVGLPRSFSILDASEAAKLVSGILDDAGELMDLSVTERKQTVKDVYRRISTAKNNNVPAQDLAISTDDEVARAGRTMVTYNQALRARGAVDFDDILLLTMQLLQQHVEVANHYAARFQHVLVDEFQDTNAVQWEITRLLGDRGNVCVVGDADQSIYAFRGADPSVLTGFTRTFPDAKVVRLGRNYRSTKAIVATAQAIIDRNPSKHRATMSTDNVAGEKVKVVALATDFDEARWVADQISTRGGNLSDHAVLVRTNSQTRALETILRERAIIHDVVGTVRFFDRAEIKDALSYLRLAVNPIDLTALERAVTAPRRGIGPSTLATVTGAVLHQGMTITQALSAAAGQGGRGAGALAKFAAALTQVEEAVAANGPQAALTVVLGAAGLADHYAPKVTGTDSDDAEARLDNLRELVSSAKDFVEGTAGADPQGRVIADLDGVTQTEAFLEYAALMSSAEKPSDGTPTEKRDAVQIATMHAAKGKEWKHVYVVGVEEGILPHKRAETTLELAEERRLMFVATSRAQETLALTHVAVRRTFKDDIDCYESRFLADLPDDVERTTAGENRVDRWRAGGTSDTTRRTPGTSWNPPRPTGRPGGIVLGGAGRNSSGASRPTPLGQRPTGPMQRPDALSEEQVPAGTQVSHPVFGLGVVIELKVGVVKVRFPNVVKVLVLAHAPLSLA